MKIKLMLKFCVQNKNKNKNKKKIKDLVFIIHKI